MAFPVVEEAIENSTATAGTSHVINLPTATAGQLLLIILDKGSTSATVNAHASLTELLDEASANGLYIAYRWMDGTEGASLTLTTSASTRSASFAYRISGAENPATQAPEIGTTSSGTSATPDPPSITPTGGAKDYLFIAFAGMAGEEADDDTWGNTPPTNYTPSPPRQKSCGVAGVNLGGLILSAERQLNAASDNPGTFGVDVSAAWRAQTIAIHPATVVPIPDITFLTMGEFENKLLTLHYPPLYDAKRLRGPNAVFLGGQDVPPPPAAPAPPIWPMIPGDPQDSLTMIKPYDCKYRKTPFQIFVTLGSGTAWTATPADSVTPSDALTFDRTLLIADTATPSDALTFDRAILIADNPAIADLASLSEGFDLQLSDNPGISDNLSSQLVVQQPINLSMRPYDKPQTKGPYLSILGGTFISTVTNWSQNVDDTLSLSDNVVAALGGVFAVNPLHLGSNFSLLSPPPPSYEKKQLKGPFPILLGLKFPAPPAGSSVNQVISDSVAGVDDFFLERHPNVDDDVLTISDQIVLVKSIFRTVGDTLGLADNVSSSLNAGGTVIPLPISDGVVMSDQIALDLQGPGFTLNNPVYMGRF
jgi:hypothetical protein